MDLPTLLRQFGEFQAQSRTRNPQLQQSEPRVYGNILHPNGQPGVGLIVIANDCDIRALEPLGKATADEDGTYTISYKFDTISRKEKNSADLLMQVLHENQLLFQTPVNEVKFNAPDECQIDIILEKGDTYVEDEYSRLDRLVKPAIGNLAIDELQENAQNRDITFLSGELREDATKLQHFALAQRLSSDFRIPSEFFYALLAENSLLGIALTDKTFTYRFAISLNNDILALFYDIVLLPPNTIASAVDQAFNNQYIPKISGDMLQTILNTLKLHESDAKGYVSHDSSQQLSSHILDGLKDRSFGSAAKILQDPAVRGDLPELLNKLDTTFSTAEDKSTKRQHGRFNVMGDNDFILAKARESLNLDAAQDESALAKLTQGEWVHIIATSQQETEGPTSMSETVNIKASQMLEYMEKRYPTVAFIANMERDPSFLTQTREILLDAFSKPGFSLHTASMKPLLSSNTGAELTGLQPEELDGQQNAIRVAAAIQRIFKLAPTYRQTKTLINLGIGSSATIHAWGRQRFIQRSTEQGNFHKAEAEATFQRATDVHLASCLMAGEVQAVTAATRVKALSNQLDPNLLEAVSQDFPNMKSLFQLGDFCACEDCRTVHSAAPYVVDTLQFLKHRLVLDTTTPTTASLKGAKDVLFSRRPDLGDTDLSCANTNIPLPYVDVVCELLEEAVSPDPGLKFEGVISTGTIQRPLFSALTSAGLPFSLKAVISDPYDSSEERIVRDDTAVCKLTPENPSQNSWIVRTLKQTNGSAEQSSSVPQYLNSTAYDVLASSVYAFGLPFDLAHEETRAYFAQFAIPRGELMRALQNASRPSDLEIAAEDLGLNDAEKTLVTNPDVGNQAKYWNSGSEPAAVAMKNVLIFVTKAAITYKHLQTLLSLKWLNPRGALSIKHLDSSCDLDRKEIAGLDDASLDTLHRFIRLWKRTHIPPEVLDRTIRATKLGNNLLTNSTLLNIRDMNLISSQLNLSLGDVCTFYSTIPVGDGTSRHSQIFLNSAANGTIDPTFEPANIQANENAPFWSVVKLSDRASYIALCLGTSEPVIQLIIGSLGGPSIILSGANLAAVYSLYTIAKAVSISIKDFLTVKTVSGIDPLSSPASTLAFLNALKKIQDANISPSNLLYFLTNNSNDAAIQDLTVHAVLGMLQTLQVAYQPIVLSNASDFNDLASPTENKRALIDVLSKIEGFDASTLAKFNRILSNTWADAGQTQAEFLNQTLSFLDAATLSAIDDTLAQTFTTTASDLDENEFIRTLIDALSAWLTKQGKLQVLNTELQSFFQFAQDVVSEILQCARLRQPASARNALLADILTDDALNSENPPLPSIDTVKFATQIRAIRLLSVMARLLPSLRLSAEQIGWLLQNSPTFGWFELDNLAYSLDSTNETPEDNINPVSYGSWAAFQDLLGIVKSYVPIENPANPKEPFTVFGLFELTQGLTTMNTFINYLAPLIGFEPGILASLGAHFGFSFSTNLAPYWQPASYLKLQKAATILRKLGLELQPAVSLCKPKLSVAESLVMRQALKARYTDSDWFGVLKNVQDPIRQKKRDALIAYILAVNPTLHTAANLYDYYLIDVEMGACMSTSRIVQAHATIQLFVQRCLMGLEPQSVADLVHDDHWSQWKWMANYRVWEANRKIFLWPENWIHPSIRLDKSELFQKFENDLSQNPLSDDAVENCFQSYLEDLEDIAQLDVMTCHYETEALTVHVFARTRGGDPPVYYHRQFIQERDWTPWMKVDLDVNGPQLLAFNRTGRLCLAWPVFIEETDPSQMNDPVQIPSLAEVEAAGGITSDPPRRRWKIQLAVSERMNGRWKAKKVSQGALYYPSPFADGGPYIIDRLLPPIESFNFFYWSLSSQQAISCVANSMFIGSFTITGCKGYPEPLSTNTYTPMTLYPQFQEASLINGRFIKDWMPRKPELAIDFAFAGTTARPLLETPEPLFKVTHPLEMSLVDWFLSALFYPSINVYDEGIPSDPRIPVHLGTFMPYFYGDFSRSYVLIPGLYGKTTVNGVEIDTEVMFPEILTVVNDLYAGYKTYLALEEEGRPSQDLMLVELEIARLSSSS